MQFTADDANTLTQQSRKRLHEDLAPIVTDCVYAIKTAAEVGDTTTVIDISSYIFLESSVTPERITKKQKVKNHLKNSGFEIEDFNLEGFTYLMVSWGDDEPVNSAGEPITVEPVDEPIEHVTDVHHIPDPLELESPDSYDYYDEEEELSI